MMVHVFAKLDLHTNKYFSAIAISLPELFAIMLNSSVTAGYVACIDKINWSGGESSEQARV